MSIFSNDVPLSRLDYDVGRCLRGKRPKYFQRKRDYSTFRYEMHSIHAATAVAILKAAVEKKESQEFDIYTPHIEATGENIMRRFALLDMTPVRTRDDATGAVTFYFGPEKKIWCRVSVGIGNGAGGTWCMSENDSMLEMATARVSLLTLFPRAESADLVPIWPRTKANAALCETLRIIPGDLARIVSAFVRW